MHGPVKMMVKTSINLKKDMEGKTSVFTWTFSREGKAQEWRYEEKGILKSYRTYDSKDRVVTGDGMEHLYNEKEKTYQVVKDRTIVKVGVLDDRGQVIMSKEEKKPDFLTWRYAYDRQGNRIKYTIESNGSFRSIHEYFYNEKGQISREKIEATYDTGGYTGANITERDARGFEIVMTDQNGDVISTYTYDEVDSRGNWLKRQILDGKGKEIRTETRTITYYDEVK